MARFKVHSKMGRPFRRNGIQFETSPTVVDATKLGWTEAQIAELKNTSALHVEALDEKPPDLKAPEPGTPEEGLVAAAVAGETIAGDEGHTSSRGRGRSGR